MILRNNTGVSQTWYVRGSSYNLAPKGEYRVPRDLPVEVAMAAFERRIADLVVEGDEPDSFWEDSYRIFWMSPFSVGDGYGTAAENMVMALDRQKQDLILRQCWFADYVGLEGFTIRKLQEPVTSLPRIGICMATPGEFRKLPTQYRIGITMYEADDPLVTHPEWRHDCMHADMLVVPSDYCKTVFRRFYKGPIEVSPLAVHTRYYTATRRKPKDTFTFVLFGSLTGRKAPIETIEAFQKAFPKEKDVRLHIKTRAGVVGSAQGVMPLLDDPRITIIDETWMGGQMLDWLLKADCMLFLSKGEGYGLPPREALATGLPVIVSDHTGLKSMCNPQYNWPVPLGKREDSPLGGAWYIPDWDYAIDAMREVYREREKAYEKAEAGAKWFIRYHNADIAADKLLKIVKRIDPRETTRYQRQEPEGLSLSTAAAHDEFYHYIEKTVPHGSLVVDLGMGLDGLAYWQLSKMGYRVVGMGGDGETLREKGINVRTVKSFDRLREKPAAIICQSTFQDMNKAEIVRLLMEAMQYTREVFWSVPTLYYPKWYSQGAKLRRRGEYLDILLGFECDMQYYGTGRRYLWGHVKNVGRRLQQEARRHGRLVDGVWHPETLPD